MKSLSYWVFIVALSIGAILVARYDLAHRSARSSGLSGLERANNQRASGFTLKAEASFRNATLTSRLAASGPMSTDEVIQFIGESQLVLPDGTSTSMGPKVATFKENLVSANPMQTLTPNSVVNIRGSVVVFRRLDVKYPREMLPDMIRLFVNDGEIIIRKTPGTKPQKMTIECIRLGKLNGYGMELLAADKKSIASRFMITDGIQEIERDNFPFQSKTPGMENVVVQMLVPKRSEPFNLTTTINQGPITQIVSPK